eukprot:10492707-Ditylum_brightwellii.AAC.1
MHGTCEKHSDNIGMLFGMDKCVILTTDKGKLMETTILVNFLPLPHDKGYKYLGILKRSDFQTTQVKNNATKEYISKLCKILKA